MHLWAALQSFRGSRKPNKNVCGGNVQPFLSVGWVQKSKTSSIKTEHTQRAQNMNCVGGNGDGSSVQ